MIILYNFWKLKSFWLKSLKQVKLASDISDFVLFGPSRLPSLMSLCLTSHLCLLVLPVMSVLLFFSPTGWSYDGLTPGCHLYREFYIYSITLQNLLLSVPKIHVPSHNEHKIATCIKVSFLRLFLRSFLYIFFISSLQRDHSQWPPWHV